MRTRNALYNSISSLLLQLVTIISGLILPKMILSCFGSSYNGITSSISQFLACANLFVAGVGGVTKAALYKPLADGDIEKTSSILNATNQFMRRIAILIGISILGMACVYPFFIKDEFGWFFTFSLVLIMGVSTFVQYFFGITYQLLIKSDQKQYVISVVQILVTVLSTVLSVVLLKNGCNFHVVKLGSVFVFLLNPIIVYLYVKKNYKWNKKATADNLAIKQRWDAFWQAIANFVHNNTDVIILTVFSNLKEVSVYTVYNYVISNMQNLIRNIVYGFGAAFGNMLAKKEMDAVHKNLKVFELIIFNISSVVYTTAGIMIVPFALLYTHGITDVSYDRPFFSIIVVLAGAFHCFRLPYQTIVEAAGHFKQTRNGALLEAAMNLVLSVILVIKFGLVGVAIGTLVATVFRSFQYALYLSKNILDRSIWYFVGHIIVNAVSTIIIYGISRFVIIDEVNNWFEWVVMSTEVVCLSVVVTLLMDLLFYKKDLVHLLSKLKRGKKHEKK